MKKNKLRAKKGKIPRIIQITPEQQVEFTAAIMESNLADNFRDALIGMINGNRWLVDGLEKGQLTTHKLRKLFGISTEKAIYTDLHGYKLV